MITSWALKSSRESGFEASRLLIKAATPFAYACSWCLAPSCCCFLGFTGLALDRAYRNSVEGGAAERLQIQVYLLLAALEQEAGEFFVIEDIQDPRYAAINSGLYGFVYDAAMTEMWRSDSALALSLPQGEQSQRMPDVGEAIFDTINDGNGERLFRFSYGILWEGIETPFSVSVAEVAAPYFSEIRDFRQSLGRWLGGAAALLLILLLILLRWDCVPLRAFLSSEISNKAVVSA